jgi:hypothetical protein
LLEAHKHGTNALSRFHTQNRNQDNTGAGWTWEKCHVLAYDEEKELFLIRWVENQKPKWVRRFNILFSGEKLDDFSRRMEIASIARNEFEFKAQEDKIIAEETKNALVPYPNHLKLGVLRKLGREISPKEAKLIVSTLLFHIRNRYLKNLL